MSAGRSSGHGAGDSSRTGGGGGHPGAGSRPELLLPAGAAREQVPDGTAPNRRADPRRSTEGPVTAAASDVVLRFAELRPERWRNGRGTTREIASGADGSGGFAWRLSLADVERPGPFSRFPRAERILTVVDGEGIVLDVEGEEHALDPGRPFPFSGDAAATATLPAGPVRALNVITGRGTVHAQVLVHDLPTGPLRLVSARSHAVLTRGRAAVEIRGVTTDLLRFDTVRGDELQAPAITGQGRLAVVSLTEPGPAVGPGRPPCPASAAPGTR